MHVINFSPHRHIILSVAVRTQTMRQLSPLKIIRNCRVTSLNQKETGKKNQKYLFYKIYQIGAKSEIHIERLRWKVDIPENCCEPIGLRHRTHLHTL